MGIASTIDRLHAKASENKGLWLFSIFCRLALAAGFIPAGITKIIGERFASGLPAVHPMGHYLEALHTTGYYYTFIGVVQVLAALMLTTRLQRMLLKHPNTPRSVRVDLTSSIYLNHLRCGTF